MFDAATAALLRSAPALPGLDPDTLPAILTARYAELSAMRLSGVDAGASVSESAWSLERIADTYELLVSLQPDADERAAAAFVAGTARQILARRELAATDAAVPPPNIDRDRVDPALAAAVLFLASEQYADAHEAAAHIRAGSDQQLYEATILSEHITDLAKGRLVQIVDRAARWRRAARYPDLEDRALGALLEALCAGVELLAAQILRLPTPDATGSRFDTSQRAFQAVLSLSSTLADDTVSSIGAVSAEEGLVVTYPGPYHAASLLLAVARSIQGASLLDTPAPSGANVQVWADWLRYRASKFPYVWSNHRSAIDKKFHETGISSVVVLPTGAGKTTVSSLKIAGVLARGKKVAFLAPTHALVEQLKEDLQEMFPTEIMGSVVSDDFDLLVKEGAVFQDIEVMTPEGCLAMLSFAPEAFQEVGLLVFDECHLLSPQTGKVRRALDAMLCVLGFHHVAPDADLLFLSAMLKNGEELARWLKELTGRTAVSVNLLWKPSRQARGVIIYDRDDLSSAGKRAFAVQKAEDAKKQKQAKGLRAAALKELKAVPYAIWGLQHNWLSKSEAHCTTTRMLDDDVPLGADIKYGRLQFKPNANQVAVRLAAAAAARELKTIVFVNTKRDATSVARGIAERLGGEVQPTEVEEERWKALEVELGSLAHSLLAGPTIAVAHNSSMLRLERDIAERMFKRADGARVIVATPTLAQGLNLPAQLAILAGDKRADTDRGGRASLEAHEILNAAARAGRAGHLANGLVLLIPEPLISFKDGQALSEDVVEKLRAVLPDDDQCVMVTDPLEVVLDRLMQGRTSDVDVRYAVNRMAVLRATESDATYFFDLRKSLGAYVSKQRGQAAAFDAKVDRLRNAIANESSDAVDQDIALLSSQSGLSVKVLAEMEQRIKLSIGTLPTNVVGWLEWLLTWWKQDEAARTALLGDTTKNVLAACGKTKGDVLDNDDFDVLLRALIAWVEGKPLREIESILGGNPDSTNDSERVCPRARELVSTVVPRSISFATGLVAHVVKRIDPFDRQEDLDRQLIECLGTLVRKGYNEVALISFASERKGLLSRVQMHHARQHWLKTIFAPI